MSRQRLVTCVAFALVALMFAALWLWQRSGREYSEPDPLVNGTTAARPPDPPRLQPEDVQNPVAPEAARVAGRTRAPDKLVPADGAPLREWTAQIERYRAAKNAVGLQALIEASGQVSDRSDRARLLAFGTTALASLGPDARLPFEDLLASSDRDIRLAAMNAFAAAFTQEREQVLADLRADPDPVVRAKAQALLAALVR